MWTNPSDEIDRRSARLVVKRHSTQLASQQAETRILLQDWSAEGITADSHLIFVHGALAHSSRHSIMFDWMVRRSEGKLHIHAYDLVGHGLSTGPRAYVEDFSVYSSDFLKILEKLNSEFSEKNFFLMGHSLGGLIVLKSMLEREQELPVWPKGIILSNPCIRPQQVVEFPRMLDMVDSLSQHFPQFRLPRLLKGKDMAISPEAANQFETDPLIPNYITARMAREVWYAAEEVRSLSYFVKSPTLMLVSEFDKVVDLEAILLFARGIDKKWITVNNYKNTAHELLHENIRQKVWRDVIDWINSLKGAA